MMNSEISIEIVYALPGKPFIKQLKLASGSSIKDALLLSGIFSIHPELDIKAVETGVFSSRKPVEHVLADGDRVEIYRPLLIDPKEARRRRAEIKDR